MLKLRIFALLLWFIASSNDIFPKLKCNSVKKDMNVFVNKIKCNSKEIWFINDLCTYKLFEWYIFIVLRSEEMLSTAPQSDEINKDTLRIVARHRYLNSIIKLSYYMANEQILI